MRRKGQVNDYEKCLARNPEGRKERIKRLNDYLESIKDLNPQVQHLIKLYLGVEKIARLRSMSTRGLAKLFMTDEEVIKRILRKRLPHLADYT